MEGFAATPFITGLEHPRRLLVLPNNDVIVAEQRTGYLTLLRDEDGDGKADYIQRYADDRAGPGCLNRFSASISGASTGVRLPSGVAAGGSRLDRA
jgi:glucose/arabinose dehydrogenase